MLMLAGAAFIIVFLLLMKKNPDGADRISAPRTLEFDAGEEDWNSELPVSGESRAASAESIAIPGYADIVLTEGMPEISLINPTDNTVAMIYTIRDANGLIFETKGISPGKMVACNLRNLIKEGENLLTFNIATYDLETFEPCNGATQRVKVTRI